MKKLAKQRIVAVFIGVVMLASIMEIALLRNTPDQGNEPQQLPGVVNRKLTLDEFRTALMTGRVVLEYFHNESCPECAAKERMYRDFAASGQFSDVVVLSYGISQNETADWLVDLSGNQIPLKDINTTADLQRLFCSDGIVSEKPNACILEEI